VTYLDHDHRESENVAFLATRPARLRPLVQPIARCDRVEPRHSLYRIQVTNDRGEAKICESGMAGAIHKDIWLDRCQYGGETKVGTTKHSLEVPMNDIAGVEVGDTPGDVG
jgi:hypothetical protein